MAYNPKKYDPNASGDPYEEYMANYGKTPAPDVSGMNPNLAIQGAGLGLDAIGKVYGAFEDQQAQEAQRKQQEAQQSHDWGRQGRMDMMSEDNNRRQGLQDSGQYADKTLEELLRNYGGYNSRIGR